MEDHSISLINIEDEMRQSYMDYAMSVIVGRALPDVRDGLKPVQRRVLYAMYSEGLVANRKHSKCAGVVGEVLKRFHPHGDSSVYDALVRLAQPWSLRYPLVDGQGNFGSVDGDPPAAYRYTECRMTVIAERLLRDINKETVGFSPNFDESTDEPDVLPAVVPNLLINGADGIAVGMATHIPPHNLTEVISAALLLIDSPDAGIEDLLKCVPGPDFPTGGIIYGAGGIVSAYRNGRGVIQIRARAEIEHLKISSREVAAIVVTEIPFQVNKSRLIEKIADLINAKEIEGISKLRDESDRSGMRIVMELKRDATPEVVLNQLYKSTPMQSSFGIINLAIVEGKPVICPLKDLLSHFLDHRRDVVTRRTEFELRQAQARMHILEGFRIALLHLDDVIALIKGSETVQDARDGLINRYDLSREQAQAILDLRLQKLTGMERLAIEKEHAELAAEIERLRSILADSWKIDEIIKGELSELRDEYGDTRRTEIIENDGDILIEDLIEEQEMAVTISHQGYAKRVSLEEYKAQHRGGKGVMGTSTKNEDYVEHLFVASTHSYLLCFTTLGRLHWLKVYQIPEAGRSARGRALVNLVQMQEGEGIAAILPVQEFPDDQFVVMATRDGYVKKVPLGQFSRVRKSGIIACTLNDGDSVIGARLSRGNDDVIIATEQGISIRFPEEDIRPMGRSARGVKGVELEAENRVVSMTIVPAQGENGTLLTVCEQGYGKQTKLSEYRSQRRGGRGLIDIQTGERNGSVVASFAIVESDAEMMLVTTSGKVIRIRVSNVSVIGRNTMGVKLIDLEEGERVAAVTQFVESEEEV
jgi:DNA gyrase subunit A